MTCIPAIRGGYVVVVVALLAAACAEPDAGAPDPQPPVVDEADDPSTVQPDPSPEDTEPGDDAHGDPDETVGPHRRAAPLPIPRTEVTGTVWDGRIVAVGGLDAQGAALTEVFVYDPDTGAWEQGPDLPTGLHHTGVTTLAGRVYVVGGYSIRGGSWTAEAAVFSLGPGEDRWREEPPLDTPRGALAVATAGGRLIALGGVDPSRQVLTSTEILTEGANAWEPGPELGTAREHLDATAVDGEVYAIAGRAGGFDTNYSSVEVLRDGRWVDGPPVQHARAGIGAATIDGAACVTGGEEPQGTIGTVECLIDGRWVIVAELEVARHGLVVAAIGRELHVIGGGPQPGLTVSDIHEVVPIDPG